MSKVLIVEDEELLSTAFRLILEKDGHEVQVAVDGQQALAVVPKFLPHLILLDLLMPKMGGLEFLKNFQPTLKKSDTKIVVLSNLQNQQNTQQAKELGAHQYLVKSQVTPTALSTLVKEIMQKDK